MKRESVVSEQVMLRLSSFAYHAPAQEGFIMADGAEGDEGQR